MALTIKDASGNNVTVTSILFADVPPGLFSLGISGFLSGTSWYFDADVPPNCENFTFPVRGGGSSEAADPEGWE
jgi:hypothetical protein